MGQALYRKYRSRKLSEIVGQKAVTTALENALKSGQISHAYLFTGPRGVGKTSIARILAFEINQIPYTSDELPIDIIEIDAASNRRIDEIRDLREKVRIAPVNAKYKVYIIDEVHMLTREAFNALLKTLEEPPAHVIFILATTEAHKLPETIISRTQRYSFKLAGQADVVDLLKSIAQQEKIAIDDEALELLAKHSGGSLRDAVSLLDQVRHSTKKVTAETVRQSLGLPSDTIISTLLSAITTGDTQAIVTALAEAETDGSSATLIAEQLLQQLRAELVSQTPGLAPGDIIPLAESLLLVESSSRPDVQLELALIGAQLHHNTSTRPIVSQAHIETTQPPLTISQPAKRTQKTSNTVAIINEQKELPATPVQESPLVASLTPITLEHWSEVLGKIRQTHNTLYGILRMAQPDFNDASNKHLKLCFQFPFHQKRMNEAKNKQVIVDTFSTIGIQGYEISCELLPKNQIADMPETVVEPFAYEAPQPENMLLNQIRSVFGGAEVLE